YLNENFGTTLSDLVGSGRMDMAVLYGGVGIVPGLSFEPLLSEEMFLVTAGASMPTNDDIPLAELRDLELLLPRSHNYLRQHVDAAFASLQMTPRVVAEIESAATLASAVATGVGATVLPVSAARAVAAPIQACLRRIVS